MAIVQLPPRFNLSSIHDFISGIVTPNGLPIDSSFEIDFGQLNFIEGDGLTVLANTLEWLRKRGVSWNFRNHDRPADVIRYLDDCGLFRQYLGDPLRTTAAVRDTTLLLVMVRHSDVHSWLEHRFSPWLASKIDAAPGAMGNIRSALKEMFINIQDHSNEESGCVHVQWYPNLSRVRVAVSDFGCGIPVSMGRRYQSANDGEAIERATQEGTTTLSTPQNRGAGLRLLIDGIVGGHGGTITI